MWKTVGCMALIACLLFRSGGVALAGPHVSCPDGHIVASLDQCPPPAKHTPAWNGGWGGGGPRGLLGLGGIGGIL